MKYNTEHLLQPVSIDEFLRTHFEQQRLLIRRRDAAYYAALFGIADMLSFLQRENNYYPNVRMVKHGRETSYNEFSSMVSYKEARVNFNHMINRERVSRLFLEQGHSVIVYQAQAALDPIRQLCDALEKDWRARVQANLYMTPAGSKGFGLHYDTHDVFILQLEGEKRWQVYDRPFHLPHDGETMENQEHHKSMLTCVFDEVLQQGDLLYLPRGHFHDVTATDVHSLHLTVGIQTSRWRSMFKRAVEEIEKEEVMRRSIPLSVWKQEELASFKDALKAAVLAGLDDRLDRLVEEYLGRHTGDSASAGIDRLARSFAAMGQPGGAAGPDAAHGRDSAANDQANRVAIADGVG
jgi:ribosomal protein L16 Arg81 hydroxylase